MAGSKLKSRVEASGILEVVISMVVIVVVFGIAIMIYTNILRGSLTVKKIKAQALLKEILIKDEQQLNNTTQFLTLQNFRIEQEVEPFGDDAKLAVIRLSAYDQNQQEIAELLKVIINE